MKIGILSQRTGVAVSALRFYESQGLLVSQRTRGNYRDFSVQMIDQVRRIQNFRALNLSLPDIKNMLDMAETPHSSCPEVCQLIEGNLLRVRQKIRQLEQQEEELQRLASLCSGRSGPSGCKILSHLEQRVHGVARSEA